MRYNSRSFQPFQPPDIPAFSSPRPNPPGIPLSPSHELLATKSLDEPLREVLPLSGTIFSRKLHPPKKISRPVRTDSYASLRRLS